MNFSKLRILVAVAGSIVAGLSNTIASAQQTFNGTTTFNGNVVMKGPSPWFDVKFYGAQGNGIANDVCEASVWVPK
jgi:hypothetical protein